jgi:hypothetical protein
MRRIFCFFILFLFSTAAFAIPIAVFTSNQTTYDIGSRAILRVHLQTEPDNKNLEFHVIVRDQNQDELVLDRIAPREFLGFSPIFTTSGVLTYTAETFLQNKRIAASLTSAISFYSLEIARIDVELSSATDPQIIADLEAERAENFNKRLAAETELARHRVKVDGTKSLEIQVL